MKYRRIDKDTVQCIVTGDDLEEYGLTMSDIFERNERGEGFLRDLIEEAHTEVGYDYKGQNIAMQISPLKDNGMVITFSEEPESTFKNFLEHMKEVFAATGGGGLDELHDLMSNEMTDNTHNDSHAKETSKKKEDMASTQYADTRVFEFASIGDVIDFAHGLYGANQVKSCLVKADEKFYLVTMKNRMSWKNYNKLSAKAFDYSNIITEIDDKLVYLGEHSETIIETGALNKLSKL